LNADLTYIRQQIGEDKTLGASATNMEQLLARQDSGVVDYCGYGPFAHTDTKPNDKPLLGFAGYRQLQGQQTNIPIIAVGGIQIADVEPLMKTGVYGMAISSAINLAVDPGKALKEVYQKIY
jgi:thiamine-phosphate pyrophosphorylase